MKRVDTLVFRRLRDFLLTAILLISISAYSDNRIVDEKTVNSWGYYTVSVDDRQFIKRTDRVPGDGPGFYPRFYLWKECFDTSEQALARKQSIEELQSTSVIHQDFDYRRIVVKESCAFIVSTDSNYFRLEFLPGVLKKYSEFVYSTSDE